MKVPLRSLPPSSAVPSFRGVDRLTKTMATERAKRWPRSASLRSDLSAVLFCFGPPLPSFPRDRPFLRACRDTRLCRGGGHATRGSGSLARGALTPIVDFRRRPHKGTTASHPIGRRKEEEEEGKRLRGTGKAKGLSPSLFSCSHSPIHSFIRTLCDPSSQYLGKKISRLSLENTFFAMLLIYGSENAMNIMECEFLGNFQACGSREILRRSPTPDFSVCRSLQKVGQSQDFGRRRDGRSVPYVRLLGGVPLPPSPLPPRPT